MKKLFVLVFAIALCLGALCVGASADIQPTKPTDGDGTAAAPYKIGTAAELYWFAQTVNEGDYDAHAVLTANITINTDVLKTDGSLNNGSFAQWTPIGDDSNAYTGTFDGNDKTISGLYYSGSGNYVGLFGDVGSGGQVKNVNVADSYISNSYSSSDSSGITGGVCGDNGGTITNCSFDGSVNGNGNEVNDVGGVCGWNHGTITNCSNTGSVTGNGTGVNVVGGVCGHNMSGSGVIMNCYNTGSVTGSGTDAYVGGVCGYNTRGTITNCYNRGAVTGSGNVGGVCGGNWNGTITKCYWLGVEGSIVSGIGNGTGEAISKTDDEFKSGEVAWLLNGEEQMNGPWRQNLSVTSADDFPVLDNNKPWVHYNGTGYENGNHAYNDGFCSCGAYQPATLDGGVYQIGNAGQLYWFAGLVNGGEYGANAVLTADITINENVLDDGSLNTNNSGTFREWTPIGEYGENGEKAYTGTFDGDGHTIRGLYYDGSGYYVGLFGRVGSGGQVKNVKVADSYINGTMYVGGVCGANNGTITNCSFAGDVTGTGNSYAGSVCGYNNGGITNCYNTGSVTGTGGNADVGGVCGYNNGGTITNCYNTGNVNGSGTYTSGVCGDNWGTITNCYNTGDVTGTDYVGGVCAYNRSSRKIENCYNIGDVTGTGYVGGVCAYNSSFGTIENCYNIGEVSGTTAGSVCGYNGNYSTITNCYWLSGKADGDVGSNNGTVTNVKSKTAEEFASGEVAWLLNSYQENCPWRQNLSDERDDYPVLDSTHEEVVKLTVDGTASYHNEGYAFSGETDKAYFKDGAEIELPYTVKEDTELTSAALYTVTVVYDNGTEDEIKSVASGDTFKLPDAPSRSGYTFVGWSDGNKTYEAGDSVTITADTTFTAVWREINIPTPNSITVTQPANGTVKVNPSNGSAGTLITVTATPDEGYELAYITVDGEKITGNTFRMPDKAVTVSAVFVPVTFPFTDVKSGDWFYDYVAYVYSNGLMDGTLATTFEPNANMTRAMVWAILTRIDGETVTGAAWADTARAWAMAEGVSDGTDPNGLVTREQFATMLYRYAVAKGYDVSIGESTNILSYADFASISEYAIPAMQWACGSGIVTGVTESTLAPQGTATRAQCAAMLMRFVEL